MSENQARPATEPAGDIVVHRPSTPARQLLLLFHGVGASPEGFEPLGPALARDDRWVVAVRSPFPSDMGAGAQWFSVRGVDEANRIDRVAVVMPRFVQTVRDWQARTGLGASATALAGFSQGAIMALASTQQAPRLASCVVAMAGRFPQPPEVSPRDTSVHFIHGDQDPVIAPDFSTAAAQRLRALGARVSIERLPGLGHAIDPRVVARLSAVLDGEWTLSHATD
jgi:phospholipase/carboxylesterase